VLVAPSSGALVFVAIRAASMPPVAAEVEEVATQKQHQDEDEKAVAGKKLAH